MDRLPNKERCGCCGTLTYLAVEISPGNLWLICPTCNHSENMRKLDERLRNYVPTTWNCVSINTP